MLRAMLLIIVSLAAVFAAEGKHLFILSGQSNMARLDPAVSFIPTVEKALGAEHVIVVKDAKGGQPIRRWYKQWKSAAGVTPKGNGDLYDQLMEKVQEAIKGQQLASISFVWMQGERDAKNGDAAVYRASLEGLVDQLEEDLSAKGIRVVVGRLSDFSTEENWQQLREAQMAACDARSHWAWVDTDPYNGPKNDLHHTKEGYVALGQAFAEQALALLKVKPGAAK